MWRNLTKKSQIFFNFPTKFFGFGKIKHLFQASMECGSMVSIAPFGPGDLGSNPGWFAVSNSN